MSEQWLAENRKSQSSYLYNNNSSYNSSSPSSTSTSTSKSKSKPNEDLTLLIIVKSILESCGLVDNYGQSPEVRDIAVHEYVVDGLMCQICLEIICDPVQVVCGHTFCRPCLVQEQKRMQRCPLDRRNLGGNCTKTPNHMVASMVNQLLVRCPKGIKFNGTDWVPREGGCTKEVALQSLKYHLEDCTFDYDDGTSALEEEIPKEDSTDLTEEESFGDEWHQSDDSGLPPGLSNEDADLALALALSASDE